MFTEINLDVFVAQIRHNIKSMSWGQAAAPSVNLLSESLKGLEAN